ncbi:MAG: biosynthetic-type acetolactate synthase large subunit, partial [Clostridia bacterium]|nr:biosynthetic-type acetolactate synthase large subunit [Clostridia bacterium]
VTDVFGYHGGQVLSIYDEIKKASRKIKHILTASEQGAAFAADGYARATGKVGVVIATSGPGATNLVTGIANAMLDSVPMLAITGNVPSYMIGKDAFQEINITGITMPITKHNFFVHSVEKLEDTIKSAYEIAKQGRSGPVLVDIPKDVQTAKCEYKGICEGVPFEQDKAEESDIKKAVRLIEKSKRPYIYVGGGAKAMDMADVICDFAEKTDGYIGASLMGLSVIPTNHNRFLGMQGMHGRLSSNEAENSADLIIGIGVRFSDRATGIAEEYAKKVKIIQLDIDGAEIDKNVMVDVSILGDIKDALIEITSRIDKKNLPQWKKKIESFKDKEEKLLSNAVSDSGISPKELIFTLNRLKNEDTVIATDVGQHQMWCAQFAEFTKQRKLLTSGGLGAMGYGLGAAIGGYVGTKERVVLITGDGSFMMNLNELATALTYKIPVTIIIVNNGVLGMVREWQTAFYNKRYSHTTLSQKTDFVKIAEGFGVKARRVLKAEEFEKAFIDSQKSATPFVIDVKIDKDEMVGFY